MAAMRSFAVLPAAGASSRMGRHKLLLPWRDGTLLSHVISQWLASSVHRVVVTVRGDECELLQVCKSLGVEVAPANTPPVDMKASVGLALQHIRRTYAPCDSDAWLLAPADLVGLDAAAIDAVLAAYDPAEPSVVAPTFAGRRGHPTLFPWRLARQAGDLASHEGLNALVQRSAVCDVPWRDDSILRDVDTRGDYALALAAQLRES
jgi:molybdenum cofactor cytidylyltransferase